MSISEIDENNHNRYNDDDDDPLVIRKESIESTDSSGSNIDIDPAYERFQKDIFALFKKMDIVWIGTYDVIYDMLRYAMELIDNNTYTTHGLTKKQYVIFAIRSYVKKKFVNSIAAEEREMCLILLKDGMISSTIDIVVDASKSKMAINNNLWNIVYSIYVFLCKLVHA